jgi:hypothetical protein
VSDLRDRSPGSAHSVDPEGMLRAAVLTVLALACSAAPASDPVELAPMPVAPAEAAPAEAPAPRLRFAATPEVAEDVIAAVELWRDATGGAYDPEVVVSEDCSAEMNRCFALVPTITDCPLTPEGKVVYGCTYPHETRRIVVSEAAEIDTRASVLAHELGHTMRLVHTADPIDDLMSPGRSHAARVHPCVTAENAALAGFDGPGACLGE